MKIWSLDEQIFPEFIMIKFSSLWEPPKVRVRHLELSLVLFSQVMVKNLWKFSVLGYYGASTTLKGSSDRRDVNSDGGIVISLFRTIGRTGKVKFLHVTPPPSKSVKMWTLKNQFKSYCISLETPLEVVRSPWMRSYYAGTDLHTTKDVLDQLAVFKSFTAGYNME